MVYHQPGPHDRLIKILFTFLPGSYTSCISSLIFVWWVIDLVEGNEALKEYSSPAHTSFFFFFRIYYEFENQLHKPVNLLTYILNMLCIYLKNFPILRVVMQNLTLVIKVGFISTSVPLTSQTKLGIRRGYSFSFRDIEALSFTKRTQMRVTKCCDEHLILKCSMVAGVEPGAGRG